MNFNTLKTIANQVSSRSTGVGRTRSGLAIKSFEDGGRRLVAIEQNPRTSSAWAVKANQGHKVVQFIDQNTRQYIAVSVDGKVIFYNHR